MLEYCFELDVLLYNDISHKIIKYTYNKNIHIFIFLDLFFSHKKCQYVRNKNVQRITQV